jgi:uncharacterized membrane protein HdeD (DUF308 family)
MIGASWRWSVPAGAATVILGVALLLAGPKGLLAHLALAGAAYLLAAAVEGAVAFVNRGRTEAWAAMLLGLSGALAGLLLLLASTAPLKWLNQLLILAIVVRAAGAGGVAMLIEAEGRGWILCRALAEAAVAILLVITVVAVLATIPFTSLSAGFLKARSGVSADLGWLVAASLIIAGVSQMLVVLRPPRRAPTAP